MMAKAKALEAQKQLERLKMEQRRQTSMSPHEKLIQVIFDIGIFTFLSFF